MTGNGDSFVKDNMLAIRPSQFAYFFLAKLRPLLAVMAVASGSALQASPINFARPPDADGCWVINEHMDFCGRDMGWRHLPTPGGAVDTFLLNFHQFAVFYRLVNVNPTGDSDDMINFLVEHAARSAKTTIDHVRFYAEVPTNVSGAEATRYRYSVEGDSETRHFLTTVWQHKGSFELLMTFSHERSKEDLGIHTQTLARINMKDRP